MKLPTTLYFEDCLKLTSIMFDSNPSVYLVIDDEVFYNQKELLLYLKEYKRKYLTLSAINTRDYQFSIGDTVMIVDTGEIRKVWGVDKNGRCKLFKSNMNKKYNYCYKECRQLVKIDPSLLTLIQD